jgi:hypothetical protein
MLVPSWLGGEAHAKCMGHPVRAQLNASGSGVRVTAQRVLQQRSLGMTAVPAMLRVVRRSIRCVSF